jgi:hypothetical protein
LSPLTENRKAKRLKKGQKLSRTLSRKVAKYMANSFYVSICYKFARKFSPKTRLRERNFRADFRAPLAQKSAINPRSGYILQRLARVLAGQGLSRNFRATFHLARKSGPLEKRFFRALLSRQGRRPFFSRKAFPKIGLFSEGLLLGQSALFTALRLLPPGRPS